MVLAASPGSCGAQGTADTYLHVGECSGNLRLAELSATMETLRVMQVCHSIGHVRTIGSFRRW